VEKLTEKAPLLAGQALQPVQQREPTVAVRRMVKPLFSDGPSPKPKEQLAVSYMLEARDLIEAAATGQPHPPAQARSVEVRPGCGSWPPKRTERLNTLRLAVAQWHRPASVRPSGHQRSSLKPQ